MRLGLFQGRNSVDPEMCSFVGILGCHCHQISSSSENGSFLNGIPQSNSSKLLMRTFLPSSTKINASVNISNFPTFSPCKQYFSGYFVLISCYDEALNTAEYEDLPYIKNNMAWCLVKIGQIDEADKHIDQVLKRYNASTDLSDDDLTKIRQYPIAVKRTLAQALFIKGYILLEKKLFKKASEYIDASIEIGCKFSVKDALPYYYKGNLFYERKDYDTAIENYRLALDINPKLAEAHDSLGVTLSKKVDDMDALKEASKEIGKALEIKPNLIPAHQHFAILQSAIGSDKAIGGTGPRFIRFWSRSRKRLIAALALLTAAVILGYLAIHLNDHIVNIQNTTRSYNNVLKMNETVVSNVNEQNRIGTYSLILVAIIILVLLLPDIQRAKVGPVELDVRSYGPGDHGPLDDLTNKLTQKTD